MESYLKIPELRAGYNLSAIAKALSRVTLVKIFTYFAFEIYLYSMRKIGKNL